jgi:hypothetical protein
MQGFIGLPNRLLPLPQETEELLVFYLFDPSLSLF